MAAQAHPALLSDSEVRFPSGRVVSSMIPTSISATAMDVATKCMARYAAENIGKNRPGGNSAPAMLGSACHAALEQYVTAVYMDKVAKPGLDLLLDLFKMQYMVIFGAHDASGPEYDDGVDMLTRWHERAIFDDTFHVYSVEVKTSFEVVATDKNNETYRIPFNYIWDRCDQLDETTYRIVDYKSWRQGIQPDDLYNKLQARCYALAAQIQFPHAKKIWVVFDQLRYDSVGVVFTREDSIATWKYLRKELKRILDTDIKDAAETINADCRWCIRKVNCDALKRNVAIGGVAGMPVADMIDRRAQIDAQMQALEWAGKELDTELVNVAKKEDAETLASENNTIYWTRRPTRGIDRTDVLEKILGQELWALYGKASITMGNVDKLLKKGSPLTDDQRSQLTSLISTTYGEPKLKTKPVNKIDGASK